MRPGRAWPRAVAMDALRRVRQDDAEGVDETAFGGAWRTDASQQGVHAAPPSEVAELARGHAARGRAVELDRSLLDPAHCGRSSAPRADLPGDSITHGSTILTMGVADAAPGPNRP